VDKKLGQVSVVVKNPSLAGGLTCCNAPWSFGILMVCRGLWSCAAKPFVLLLN